MLDRNVVCSNCLITYNANEDHECTRCGSTERCSLNPVDNQGWEMGEGLKEEPKGEPKDNIAPKGTPSRTLFDSVKFVSHYQIFPEYKIEARHIIARCIVLSGLKGDKAYHYGNALKYLLRLNRKGDMEEDASKAQEYLEFLKE